jgi:cytochrome c oxidase subunit II
VPNTAGQALAALNCGQLCAPEAITTYPFKTDRNLRSASERSTS